MAQNDPEGKRPAFRDKGSGNDPQAKPQKGFPPGKPGGGNGRPDSELSEEEILAKIGATQAQANRWAEALTKLQDRKKAEAEADTLIDDYDKERHKLLAAQTELETFRDAELEFANTALPAGTREKIAKVGAGLQAEIDRIEARIATKEEDFAETQAALGTAKKDAADADAELKMLGKPVAAIQDRHKAADAIRKETNKAEEGKDYALAFWLVRPGGPLDALLEAELQIIDPAKLRARLAEAQEKKTSAEKEVAAGDALIKEREAEIKAEKAKVADLKKTLETRTREAVTALNPKTS